MAGKQLSAGGSPLKAEPPADRRGAQMKDPSERTPRGKYAGGILEKNGLPGRNKNGPAFLRVSEEARIDDAGQYIWMEKGT